MKSVLADVTTEDVISDPAPHICLKDVLEDGLCTRLIEEFPVVEELTAKSKFSSNKRMSFSAGMTLENEKISPLWREFVRTHVSSEFFESFRRVFGGFIPAMEYPYLPSLDGLRPGIRKINTPQDSDMRLDAQICMNTPVLEEPSAVRRGHIDAENKLYFGLLYLRHPEDDSTGGDLELYRYRAGMPQPGMFNDREISDKRVGKIYKAWSLTVKESLHSDVS